MQQVLVEVIDEGPGMISRIAQHAEDLMARLGRVADVLERKLSPDEARQFELGLMRRRRWPPSWSLCGSAPN